MTYRNLVIDGSYLARSRYEAGGVGNLLRGSLALVYSLQPGAELIHVAWDSPTGSARRRQISERYKSSRPPQPEEYTAALPRLRELLGQHGVISHESPDGEGDDVIATLSATLPGPTLLWSADKDLLQLVRPGVDFIRSLPSGDYVITEDNCAEVTGLSAGLWVHYQAIVGDSCDGVRGVRGVGDKGARLLLSEDPRAVERIIAGNPPIGLTAKAQRVEARVREHLRQEDVDLVTLVRDVELVTTDPTGYEEISL